MKIVENKYIYRVQEKMAFHYFWNNANKFIQLYR